MLKQTDNLKRKHSQGMHIEEIMCGILRIMTKVEQ